MEKNKKIKLGLFSYSYHLAFGKHDVFCPKQHKPMDIFHFMDRAAELELDGIQIDPMHLEQTDDTYLDKVVAYAKERNLYIEYGTTGIEANHLLEQLRIAHRLGSPILRTYIGFNPREVADVQQEVAYALAQLEQVKAYAQQNNIRIAIENHCDLKAEELLQLVQRANSPYIGVCVDLGNFMIHLENPTESVRLLAPYIYSTHFKDYASEMMNWGFKTFGVPLGEGSIDLKATLAILINESKLDRIMLELPVEKAETEDLTLQKEDRCVVESVKYARNVLLSNAALFN